MSQVKRALDDLSRWRQLGEIMLADGTRLIGRVPHVAPEAWLHQLFGPLAPEKVHDLQESLHFRFPKELADFYTLCNGLNMFSCTLCIYGRRTSYARRGEAIWQPFDIVAANTIERPRDSSDTMIFVGSYNWDGSLVYIDCATGRAARCARDAVCPLSQWPSFEKMLTTEVVRIARLFDEHGRQKDDEAATTP